MYKNNTDGRYKPYQVDKRVGSVIFARFRRIEITFLRAGVAIPLRSANCGLAPLNGVIICIFKGYLTKHQWAKFYLTGIMIIFIS